MFLLFFTWFSFVFWFFYWLCYFIFIWFLWTWVTGSVTFIALVCHFKEIVIWIGIFNLLSKLSGQLKILLALLSVWIGSLEWNLKLILDNIISCQLCIEFCNSDYSRDPVWNRRLAWYLWINIPEKLNFNGSGVWGGKGWGTNLTCIDVWLSCIVCTVLAFHGLNF